MNAAHAYDELVQRVKDAAVLGSCAGLLGWDERTYLPPKGAAFRGEQMALLARLGHEWITAPRIGELLAALGTGPLSDDPQGVKAANVREVRRAHDRAVKVPKRLVEELARVTTQAQSVWAESRRKSDFAGFRPWLERIVALKREEAQAVGYTGSPYDALLDEFEPGATAAEVRELFAVLRRELAPLIAAIAGSSRKPRTEVLAREYPVDQQEAFAKEAARAIGFDFEAGRLDVTTHPFCSGIAPGDCRITTRYNPRFFNEAFFGVLHEAGHGMYEQGLPAEFFGLAAGIACSLGLHESQSRFWENQVGRSRPFWEHFFPLARQCFPAALGDVNLDEFHFAINEVKPSFIRVEADEATYNLHIILRFELEEALIRGDLQAADVPGAWNEKFRASFDLTPPSDALGCLQDIHWSSGGIGYFPTYTLGNLYAAQWMEAMRRDLGDVDADLRRGEFARVLGWLRQKIHHAGRTWPAGELCRRVTGAPLSTQPLLRYLRGKYGALYGV
jgi:carboxypeptidase Taq